MVFREILIRLKSVNAYLRLFIFLFYFQWYYFPGFYSPHFCGEWQETGFPKTGIMLLSNDVISGGVNFTALPAVLLYYFTGSSQGKQLRRTDQKIDRTKTERETDREITCVNMAAIMSVFPQLTSLELQYVSPKLLMCRDLELAVPGTYDPNQPVIRIQSIAPSLQVITSKQRPRKLTIMGKAKKQTRESGGGGGGCMN